MGLPVELLPKVHRKLAIENDGLREKDETQLGRWRHAINAVGYTQ